MLRTARIAFITLSGLFFLASASGCSSFIAVKTGKCNPGRTWVEPVKKDGQWKDGYCRSN